MNYRLFLLLTLSLLLSACGGGGDSDSSDGGSAPATVEVLAPQARDSYDQLLTANQPNASNDVSLRGRVSDPQGLALRLLSVQPLTSQCQPPVVNSEALSFRVDNGSADACTYAYTIENVPTNGATPKRTQATSYVVVSAASSPAMLPILSHTAVVNETIAIDLASELGGYFPAGFTLQPEVIVLGSGTALADPASNTINYTAAAVPGITRLVYSYLSADGTEVRAGAIDVSVSKVADGMPQAENFPGPEDVLPGAVVTVDVKDHISDPDGDPLQLTDAYAFDATVSATDATSLSNTRFDFVADKPGSYDVSYYVTDHNGGYAIGVVRITVKAKSLWGDIILSDGSRYTAPWEKNLADGLGIPYQDFYEETNATGTYQVALFNYETALTLCAARGMVLPTIAELNKLRAEKPDPASSDNWPVERPYWTGEALDSSNNGQVYDLVSGSNTLKPMMTPAGVSCIYSGLLAGLETTVDNQYVSGSPTSSIHDKVTALVTAGDGSPLPLKNVYFYSSNGNLSFSQKQVMTDADGKAIVTVDSPLAGTFTVYANYLTQTLNTAVTFIDNLVSSLTITGTNKVRMGQSINLTASATYDSSDVVDVSAEANWASSEPATATVASGVVTGVTPGTVDISASFSGADAAAHPVTVFSGLSSLVVTPDRATLDVGATQDLIATAHYDDGASEDVTATATWSSNNGTVASVVGGEVTAKAGGSAAIQASYTDSHGISQVASAVITVTVPAPTVTALQITPETSTVAVRLTRQFEATALLSDGSSRDVTNDPAISWSSSNTNVASISVDGLATGGNTGVVTIKASGIFDGQQFEANAQLTVAAVTIVGLRVAPDNITLPKGLTQNYYAYATMSDGSQNVNVTNNSNIRWSVANSALATVTNTAGSKGLLTAHSPGVTEVKVYDELTGVYGGTPVNILETTLSQHFGVRFANDKTANYLLGESNQLAFQCGAIIDAIGTPELPLTGGTGGTHKTTSGLNISSVEVSWGRYQYSYDPAGIGSTLSKITINYTDRGPFSCGNKSGVSGAVVSNVQTATWTVPVGEKFIGLSIYAGAYSHEVTFASVQQ